LPDYVLFDTLVKHWSQDCTDHSVESQSSVSCGNSLPAKSKIVDSDHIFRLLNVYHAHYNTIRNTSKPTFCFQ